MKTRNERLKAGLTHSIPIIHQDKGVFYSIHTDRKELT